MVFLPTQGMFQALTKIGQKHGLGGVVAWGPGYACPQLSSRFLHPAVHLLLHQGPHDPVGGNAWGRGGATLGNVGGAGGKLEVGSV